MRNDEIPGIDALSWATQAQLESWRAFMRCDALASPWAYLRWSTTAHQEMWRWWLAWSERLAGRACRSDAEPCRAERRMQSGLQQAAEELVSSQLNWARTWAESERDLRQRARGA